MKKLIRREWFVPLVVSLVMLALNAYPWLYRIGIQTPDRALIPYHNSTGDYPTYVSAVKQGIDGHILTYNKYAVAPHAPGLYFVLYSLLGFMGKIVRIQDAHVLYHLGRYLAGVAWCVSLYVFFRAVFRTRFERVLAFVFALTSSGFPIWKTVDGVPMITTYMSWWTEFDPVKRIAFLPHHMAGHSLMLFAVISLKRAVDTGNFRVLMLSAVLGWTAGFVHPPSLIILILTIPLFFGVYLRKTPRRHAFWIVFCAVSCTSLLLMNWQARQFPWSGGWLYESQSFALSIPEVILALGPVVLLAVPAVFVRSGNPYVYISVLWISISVFMMWFAKWRLSIPNELLHMFPISNMRFLQTALWVPLAVLGAVACGYAKKRFGVPVVIVILALYAGVTLLGYPSTVTTQKNALLYNEDYHAPTLDWFRMVHALDSVGSAGPVISLQWTGSLIPTYTGRTAYVGADIITPDFSTRIGSAYTFYAGLPVCTAYDIVRDGKVAAVVSGFDESLAGHAVNSYPFLSPYGTYGTYTIYTVKKWDGCNEGKAESVRREGDSQD